MVRSGSLTPLLDICRPNVFAVDLGMQLDVIYVTERLMVVPLWNFIASVMIYMRDHNFCLLLLEESKNWYFGC